MVPAEVSEYPEETYNGRRIVLESFRRFIEEYGKPDSKPESLGRLVGELRRNIFDVGLLEGGFSQNMDERSLQDSGSVFELILHVIGRGFLLEHSRIPVKDNDTKITQSQISEITPQGVFYLKGEKSVQELVNEQRIARPELIDRGCTWKVQDADGTSVNCRKHIESEKILGTPPELLIIRVDNHVVNPSVDDRIDFSPLFKNATSDGVYELVGFSQNRNQSHWTSVVHGDDGWKYCDDSRIYSTTPENSNFKHPANYMIYRKKS